MFIAHILYSLNVKGPRALRPQNGSHADKLPHMVMNYSCVVT